NSAAVVPSVRFNEIMTSPESGPDWIELLNTTAATIDLAGWLLREAGNTNHLVFPAGSSLGPGAYLVVQCDKTSNTPAVHAPFALDSENETVLLQDAAGTRIDVISTGAQARGYSLGIIDGKLTLTQPTPAHPNQPAPLRSPASLVINEWLASSGPGEA